MDMINTRMTTIGFDCNPSDWGIMSIPWSYSTHIMRHILISSQEHPKFQDKLINFSSWLQIYAHEDKSLANPVDVMYMQI